MSTRRHYMTSNVSPLLGPYESLLDVILRRHILTNCLKDVIWWHRLESRCLHFGDVLIASRRKATLQGRPQNVACRVGEVIWYHLLKSAFAYCHEKMTQRFVDITTGYYSFFTAVKLSIKTNLWHSLIMTTTLSRFLVGLAWKKRDVNIFALISCFFLLKCKRFLS